jgi:hypothetical protein
MGHSLSTIVAPAVAKGDDGIYAELKLKRPTLAKEQVDTRQGLLTLSLGHQNHVCAGRGHARFD